MYFICENCKMILKQHYLNGKFKVCKFFRHNNVQKQNSKQQYRLLDYRITTLLNKQWQYWLRTIIIHDHERKKRLFEKKLSSVLYSKQRETASKPKLSNQKWHCYWNLYAEWIVSAWKKFPLAPNKVTGVYTTRIFQQKLSMYAKQHLRHENLFVARPSDRFLFLIKQSFCRISMISNNNIKTKFVAFQNRCFKNMIFN